MLGNVTKAKTYEAASQIVLMTNACYKKIKKNTWKMCTV